MIISAIMIQFQADVRTTKCTNLVSWLCCGESLDAFLILLISPKKKKKNVHQFRAVHTPYERETLDGEKRLK